MQGLDKVFSADLLWFEEPVKPYRRSFDFALRGFLRITHRRRWGAYWVGLLGWGVIKSWVVRQRW